jgi:hypothetical protein
LRSLFELKDAEGAEATQWIKTIPGKGWFVYFRIYGPEAAAFDGKWKPGNFEEVKHWDTLRVLGADVRYWHETDQSALSTNVGS